jgi:hypothetical protein
MLQRCLIGVGVCFFSALVWYFGWQNIRDRLVNADLPPLLWMTAFIVAGFWVRALKWRYVLGPGRSAMGLFFLAKMAGTWTPARVGELSPLFLKKHRSAAVAAWIGYDRVVEVLFTLILGFLGVASLGMVNWPVVAVLSVVGAGTLAVMLGLLSRKGWLEWLQQRCPDASLRLRGVRLLDALHEETVALGSKTPVVLIITLSAKVMDVYAVMLLCQAFGYEVPFLLVCAARCAHALVSAVPLTPDVTGVPFAAQAAPLHHYAGIPGETLFVALGLEFAIINLVQCLSFGIGLVDLRRDTEKKKQTKDSE